MISLITTEHFFFLFHPYQFSHQFDCMNELTTSRRNGFEMLAFLKILTNLYDKFQHLIYHSDGKAYCLMSMAWYLTISTLNCTSFIIEKHYACLWPWRVDINILGFKLNIDKGFFNIQFLLFYQKSKKVQTYPCEIKRNL